MFEEDEEYKKKLERARQLRNSIGMVTNKDKQLLNISSPVNNITSNSTSMFSDNNVETDYQQKLKRARELRNSIGMITTKDKEIDEIQRQINESKNNNFVSMPSVNSNVVKEDNKSTLPRTEEVYNNEVDTDANKGGIFLTSGNKKMLSPNESNADNNLNAQKEKIKLSQSQLEDLGALPREKRLAQINLMTKDRNQQKDFNIQVENFVQDKLIEQEANKINENNDNNNFWSSIWHVLSTIPTNLIDNTMNIFASLDSILSKKNNTHFAETAKMITSKNDKINAKIENDLVRTLGNVGLVIGDMLPSIASELAMPGSGRFVAALGSGSSSYLETLNEEGTNKAQALTTALLKGGTTYWTEGITGGNILGKGSLDDVARKFISNTASKNISKRILSKAYEIGGEILEEQVENNVGYVIDKIINNKNITAEEYWAEFNETNKITFLTTVTLGLFGMGGNTYKEILNDERLNKIDTMTQKSIEEADKIIKENNLSLVDKAEPENKDIKTYTILDIDNDSNILGLTQTVGKEIELKKNDLNVKPAVVRNHEYFEIIDSESGIKLDTSGYLTEKEAIEGFNSKIKKADKGTIANINNKSTEGKLAIINTVKNIQNTISAYNNIENSLDYSTQNIQKQSNVRTPETSQRQYTKEQYDKITRTVNQISDDSVYNFEEANNAFDTVSNNIKNVNVIEQSGNRYLNSLDKEGYVVHQQKLNKKKYTGKDIKEIINTAISHADTSNIYEEININNTQASSEPNASNFYTNETNYAVQDIKKVKEAFNKQKSYSKDKLAEIWNNEVSDNNYDAYYDKNGNIERYIAIEEDGDNIVVNQYDDNNDIVKSEIIPSKNGRYSAKAIKDTIERVSSLYDENRPIKGQRDTEGNEVLSMKKEITNNIEENNIQEDIENFSNQVEAVLDGSFPKNSMLTLLKETPRPLQDIGLPNLPITMTQKHLDTIMNKTGKYKGANYHNLGIDTIKQLPESINNPLDIVISNTNSNSIVLTTYLADEQERTIIASVKISGIGRVNDIMIDTNVMTSAYGRNNYEAWMDKNLKEGKLLYDIDRGVIKKVDRARLQLPRTINSRDTVARFQLPGSNISTTNKTGSSINHSIPQTTEVVKSDIAINKQSMQNNENNTQDSIKGQRDIEGNEVLSMKKETSEEFNNKNQYKNVTELLKAEVEKAGNNFNTDIKIEQIDELENINFKKITQNEYIKLSKNIFKNSIKKRTFQNDNSNIKIKVILDDIKESAYKAYSNKFQNKYLKEHIQALSKIDIIIENANEKSKNIETKSRNQYKDWKYFISEAIINDKPFLIEFDVTNKNDGYHFRLQRLVELNLKNNRDTTLALPKNQGGANSR